MSTEHNKSIAYQFRETLWEPDGLKCITRIMDEDCLLHVEDPLTPFESRGHEPLANVIRTFLVGFPKVNMTVREMVAEGDAVCVYWTAAATHSGEIWGTPATNRTVTTSGIDLLHFKNGLIVEARTKWDALGLLRQIGVTKISH